MTVRGRYGYFIARLCVTLHRCCCFFYKLRAAPSTVKTISTRGWLYYSALERNLPDLQGCLHGSHEFIWWLSGPSQRPLWGKVLLLLFSFTDDETEAREVSETCRRSPSWDVVELGRGPGQGGSWAWAPDPHLPERRENTLAQGRRRVPQSQDQCHLWL